MFLVQFDVEIGVVYESNNVVLVGLLHEMAYMLWLILCILLDDFWHLEMKMM